VGIWFFAAATSLSGWAEGCVDEWHRRAFSCHNHALWTGNHLQKRAPTYLRETSGLPFTRSELIN